MKYEVLEKLYEIEKNNGETFQVNIIKWNDGSTRYDLRVWSEDIPMQGIVFSANELKDFCCDILQHEGVSAVSVVDEEDFTTSNQLVDINLKALLAQIGELSLANAKIKSLMRDIYPNQEREINLCYNLIECGVAKQIATKRVITETDLHRYSNILENRYGIKKSYSLWSIQMWADAYNVRCSAKTVLEQWKKTDNTRQKPLKPIHKKELIRKKKFLAGDTLIDNDDVTIIYKGLDRYLHFIFEVHNKGVVPIRVELAELEINDFTAEYSSLGIALPAGKKTVSRNLWADTSSAAAIGIKNITDINSLKIRLQYRCGTQINASEEFELDPELV